VACTNWTYKYDFKYETIGQMLAVTKLNIKQALIEQKPVCRGNFSGKFQKNFMKLKKNFST